MTDYTYRFGEVNKENSRGVILIKKSECEGALRSFFAALAAGGWNG